MLCWEPSAISCSTNKAVLIFILVFLPLMQGCRQLLFLLVSLLVKGNSLLESTITQFANRLFPKGCGLQGLPSPAHQGSMQRALPGGWCLQTYEQDRHLVPSSALAQPGKPWPSSTQRCAQPMGTWVGAPERDGGVCSTLQLWEEGQMSAGQSSPSWGH